MLLNEERSHILTQFKRGACQPVFDGGIQRSGISLLADPDRNCSTLEEHVMRHKKEPVPECGHPAAFENGTEASLTVATPLSFPSRVNPLQKKLLSQGF